MPSEIVRRDIVTQLAALGHDARATASFDEALALVDAGAIDTLILHVSAFSTSVLARLGGAVIRRRRSIALIASVSVVSAACADRGPGIRQEEASPAPGPESPWQVATYWLSYSRPSEYSAWLTGSHLN